MLREGLLQDQPEAVHAVSPRPQVKPAERVHSTRITAVRRLHGDPSAAKRHI